MLSLSSVFIFSFPWFSMFNSIPVLPLFRHNHNTQVSRSKGGLAPTPFPLLCVAALLLGGEAVRSVFRLFVELVMSWNLPDCLVHWGHPSNILGIYIEFLCLNILQVEKASAKDLHPKLFGGFFFFFALGATGGIISLLTSNKPIFESPYVVMGVIGLALLTIQTILPALF
ncbi:hypothetical protein E2542_SST28044 [Spatholobus suberectus]|nr:hypothetical protein E2542_SST28044 [Spatholobus suberectus]